MAQQARGLHNFIADLRNAKSKVSFQMNKKDLSAWLLSTVFRDRTFSNQSEPPYFRTGIDELSILRENVGFDGEMTTLLASPRLVFVPYLLLTNHLG